MFSCILAMTSSWLREPPLTPMRTGRPRSTATLQMVANCSSRLRPVPTLPGLMRYLSSASAQSGIPREQQMAVVMKVANQRSRTASVHHSLLDFGDGGGGFGDVDGDAHHLGAGLPELDALLRRSRRIRGLGHRHRLDDDWSAPADGEMAHANGHCAVTLREVNHSSFFQPSAINVRFTSSERNSATSMESKFSTRSNWLSTKNVSVSLGVPGRSTARACRPSG